ncbi:MAG: alpha/beta hydrolase [Myxococcaceae bacterium]|jgi:pimeloyl-ACP methyl ester carboxylesterase|nr:alpha/beta hydrolase [Myxococcaceae bacterium]MCA3010978.1 alpha/beta hydrolase [Myxococcaceae bacterium]
MSRTRAAELREAVRLAVEATRGVTGVVQDMHVAIGGGPALLGRPLEPLVTLLSAPTYAGIRLITEWVGRGLDTVLEQLEPVLGPGGDSREYDLALGVLNGVLGDRLEAQGSTLAIRPELRRRDRPLDELVPPISGRVLVLVHGSCATDACFERDGQHLGEALEASLGLTWVAARYNSGLHVSTNGSALSQALEALVERWPVPVESLAVVAHSMGGLVARAACLEAEAHQRAWRRHLSTLVFLGTPHQGAPLERFGNAVGALLARSRASAPLRTLAQLRSAGITDLRFGLTRDEEWQRGDRFDVDADPRVENRLPQGVRCYAVAATLSKELQGPFALGDGLVPIASALGQHASPALALDFPQAHQVVLPSLGHQDLISDRRVLEHLRAWLS